MFVLKVGGAGLFTVVMTTAVYYYCTLPLTGFPEPGKVTTIVMFVQFQRFMGRIYEFLGFGTSLEYQRKAGRKRRPPVDDPSLLVTDTAFDGVKVRVYQPRGQGQVKDGAGLVFMHGGGWIPVVCRYQPDRASDSPKAGGRSDPREGWDRDVMRNTPCCRTASYHTGLTPVSNVIAAQSDLRPEGDPTRGRADTSGDTEYPVLYSICTKDIFSGVRTTFRLAPEHMFLIPFKDCLNATKYFLSHAGEFGVDPGRVGVAGDSTGGNLAAAVALKLTQESSTNVCPLKLQALVYPALQAFDFQTDSYRTRKSPFLDGLSHATSCNLYLTGNVSWAEKFERNAHISESMKTSRFAACVDRHLLDPSHVHPKMTPRAP
ncbi:carboxylic ester hydrolase [Branchiostoma belcheri]|nr:carboxylic ester hydrolase [Branchiostoma belcheri]